MAQLTIDLSGKNGLADKYAGDLNDSTAKPHLRYLAEDGQMVDGFFNPFRLDGYMSPINAKFANLSGTISGEIRSALYDPLNDFVYFAQNTGNLLRATGLDATSVSALTNQGSITGVKIQDLELYEINGFPAVLFSYSNERVTYNDTDDAGLGIGFRTLDSKKGVYLLSADVTGTTAETIASGANEKLAQKFRTQDFTNGTNYAVTGVKVKIRNLTASPQTTWNVRIGIQTDNGSGRPSGTYVTNGYVDTDPDLVPGTYTDFFVEFPAVLSLSSSTTYHLVVEPTDYSAMSSASGILNWIRSTGAAGLYPDGQAQQYITAAWANAAGTDEAFDFAIVLNTHNNLVSGAGSSFSTGLSSGGSYTVTNDFNHFLVKADNGFLYWFTGNLVHKLDGALTGGNTGSFTPEVLSFPTYLTCVDAVDVNSTMYIGVQSTPVTGTTTKAFATDVCGLFVWDRQSLIANMRNFVPAHGAKEIKKVFVTPDGQVRVITIGDDKFAEIRGISGGSLVVLKKLGLNAYPAKRDGMGIMNNINAWLAADGYMYGWGRMVGQKNEALYRFGDMNSEKSGTLTSGVFLPGLTDASNARQSVLISWADTSPTNKIQRWYPHATGTISSVAQLAKAGDVFSGVQYLPYLATLRSVEIRCAPTAGDGSTVIATVKYYLNQSSTVAFTYPVTRDQASRGYVVHELNQPWVNAVQIEIEWNTSNTLGDNDFLPSVAVVTYEQPKKRQGSGNPAR